LMSTKAVQTDDKFIDLEFGYASQKNMVLKAENLNLLESICASVIGRPVKIRAFLANKQHSEPEPDSNGGDFKKLADAAGEFAEKHGALFDIVDE
ncbi:MAG: hypothetical protein PHV32_16710, partial [Eubacteriales bacterium]|nr:hypothetical protein [Eubacteriales bacterium]